MHDEFTRFKTIFDNAPLGVFLTTVSGRFENLNNQLVRIFGYESIKDIKSSVKDLATDLYVNPADRDRMLRETLGKKEISVYEVQFKKKDGGIVDARMSIRPYTSQINKEKYLIGIVEDITEQKRLVREVKINEYKYRSLFQKSGDAIFILENTTVIEFNEKAREIFQIPADTKPFSIFDYAPEYQSDGQLTGARAEYRFKELGKGIPQNFEYLTYSFDGHQLIYCEVSLSSLSEIGENYYLALLRDITQRKQVERELFNVMVTSEEIERGRYAKELHDGLGPILSTSLIYLNTMLEESDPDTLYTYIKRTIGLIEDSINSIREISNNLSPDILRNYGLVQAVRSFIEKLAPVSKTQFSIKSNLDKRLQETVEVTLYRTLVELINNTMKYSEASQVKINIADLNQKLQINYSDNGIGFDYKKSKEERKGFGLLNLESRIKNLGGSFNFSTKNGKGISVNIVIQNK